MIHEKGNQLIVGLEKRLGRMALPQILRWVAVFQALSWGLTLFSNDFLLWIQFDREAILSGQVWRLLTWALMPISQSPIFVLIALLFMFFINDGLEGHWGAFRLNLYVLASVAVLALVGMVPLFAPLASLMGSLFYSSAFLAFASLFPNQIIHLFLVIPIKAKWLGFVNAAFLLSIVFTSSAILLVGVFVIAGLGAYLLVFVPAFVAVAKQRKEIEVRRHRFKGTVPSEDEPFHSCEACEANDRTHPELGFRVSADGRELCERCLERGSKGSSGEA